MIQQLKRETYKMKSQIESKCGTASVDGKESGTMVDTIIVRLERETE
jgi:hypothetical protein